MEPELAVSLRLPLWLEVVLPAGAAPLVGETLRCMWRRRLVPVRPPPRRVVQSVAALAGQERREEGVHKDET